MNLTRRSWPKGWNPSADNMNGDPSGLLRMDNLTLDQEGVLSLVRGYKELGSSFSDYVSDIYSKVISGQEQVWVGLNNGAEIFRAPLDDMASKTTVSSGGGTRPAFGDALGQIIACSGNQKKKDDGTTIRNLGIVTPLTAPSVASISQPQVDLQGAPTLVEGHDLSIIDVATSAFKAFLDSTTLRGSVDITLDSAPQDTTNMGTGPSSNPGNDTFLFLVQFEDTSKFNRIRVEIPVSPDETEYYWMEWPLNGNVQYRLGKSIPSVLSARRSDFTRQGTDSNFDWTTVQKIRVIAEGIADTWFLASEFRFVGGASGQLNGNYQYCEVHVFNSGKYEGKSPISPISDPTLVINGTAVVNYNGSTDTQVNEVWLFRRSVPATEFVEIQNLNGQNVNVPIPIGLDQFYRVAVISGRAAGSYTDSRSDIELLEDNITLNLFLQSLQDVTDPIVGIEGLYNERVLYLTTNSILLSDRLNIDAIDTRFTIKAFGDPTEVNLWLKKVSNQLLILATTKDLYEIAGTLLDQPDGTIDASVKAVGEAYPPLSQDVASTDGALFYAAADGWRVTTGSNSTNISYQLRLLLQGISNLHGVPGFVANPGNTTRYAIAIGRGKLFATTQCVDGTRRLLIYDIKAQTWRLQFTDPIVVHVTQSDRVLLGYGLGSGNFVQEMEFGDDGTVDKGQPLEEGQPIFFQTIYDANEQPRNRKETFTLKLIMDTGGRSVNVYLASDGQGFVPLTDINGNVNVSTSSGPTTFYFPLFSYSLGFRYAIKIVDHNLLTFFKLYELTLEYDPRPEQNVWMVIPSTNLGTYARKRITAYAFVIDTLGHNVTFTPYLDGVAKSSEIFSRSGKLTYIHFFTDEEVCTDIGGTLLGTGPFEFYNLNLEETVSEKLPTPVEYFVIPSNDYGNPNRKRHTSYKFQILTRGKNVKFTPIVDGVSYAPATFNTTTKRTVEYFFDTSIEDVTGIDIGGVLETLESTPFEFYGVIVPQHLELLPDRLESLFVAAGNYGIAAPKRLRTLPIVINTNGYDVTFVPYVDNVALTGQATVLNTSRKQTAYHYFTTDVFGVDYGGRFSGSNPFEFHEFGQPEQVEVLPVPKKFDQLGPYRFDKIGKMFKLRFRLIATGSSIPYIIYPELDETLPTYGSTQLINGIIQTTPGIDNIYEILLPKSINSTLPRIVLGPCEPFYRFDCLVQVAQSGMETDAQWVPIK